MHDSRFPRVCASKGRFRQSKVGRNYLKTLKVWLERENTDAGVDLKAIRLFCLAAVLVAMFAAASVQAQEPVSPREQLPEGTATSSLDAVPATITVALAEVSQDQISQDQISQ